MLAVPKPRRKQSARSPFLAPLWDDHHPDCQRLDAALPPDHHARWLVTAVAHLDLTACRRSYAGSGSLAYPVEPLLAFALFLYAKGILSPAEWARQARYDDQAKWLLRGLRPSRAQLYTFRDRLEPFLDGWHQQLLAWAIAEGITSARRGSLDGTFVAALASRHQLFRSQRLDRRLLLLRLLVWYDAAAAAADLHGPVQALPELVLNALGRWLELLCWGVADPFLAGVLLPLLALLELLPAADTPLWQPRLPAWVPQSVAGRQRVLKRYEAAQQRLAARLEPLQRKPKLSKKDQQTVKNLKVSVTEPEAALGWDKVGTFRPLYNVVLVQATDAPLTLAWDVLARNNDEGLLPPLLDKTKAQVGHHLDEVLVDGAFINVGDVAWCEQQSITVYAPPSAAPAEAAKVEGKRGEAEAAKVEGKRGEAEAAKVEGKRGEGKALLPKAAFRYDATEQVYYCPQGKRLEVISRTKVQRSNGLELPMIVHRAAGEDCRVCPEQARCTSSPAKGRVVKRYEGEEALERLAQRMAEPASQQVYKERGRSVELGYADLKEHRGLRQFRGFGKQRARVQAGLVILASNGLKIMAALQRRQTTAQAPPPEEQAA